MIAADTQKYLTELEKLKARNKKQKKYILELRKEIANLKQMINSK